MPVTEITGSWFWCRHGVFMIFSVDFFPSVWYRKWDKNLLLSAEKPAPLFNIMQRSFYVMEVIRKSGNRKGEIPARKKLMPALKMTENICFQGV